MRLVPLRVPRACCSPCLLPPVLLCASQVDKYTYQVCPFGSATQKEGHSSTSLGKWQEFGGNFSSMKFTGGQGCWQGPPRSMEVRVGGLVGVS